MAYFYKVEANNKQGYKWVCVKDGPPDPVTGKRKQISRRADGKKEAEKRVDKALEELQDSGIDEQRKKHITFDEVALEWLKTYSKGKVKDSTIRVREKEIKILNRYIAKLQIDKITSRKHQSILNDLDDQEYARSTIEGVHVTAGLIYKYAIKEKYRKDNPSAGAIIPEKKQTVEDIENDPIEEKYLEHSELDEFLDVAKKHGRELDMEIFYLLAFSGMRSGELCALKWSDLDFEANMIRVTKTLYNPDNNMRKFALTPPKTKGSVRKFTMDEAIMKLMKTLQKKQKLTRLKYRAVAETDDIIDESFVFCRPNGYPFIQKNILQRMERLLKLTSIKKHATPHIFRHTHISMMAEAEIDINTIMKRVGHDDMKTTLRIYTHVTEKMHKTADQKLNMTFGDLLNF